MSDIFVNSNALINVYVDGDWSSRPTVRTVREWLAEVDRLNIPNDHPLDDCSLDLVYRSEILEPTHGESALGVQGIDIVVGMPR